MKIKKWGLSVFMFMGFVLICNCSYILSADSIEKASLIFFDDLEQSNQTDQNIMGDKYETCLSVFEFAERIYLGENPGVPSGKYKFNEYFDKKPLFPIRINNIKGLVDGIERDDYDYSIHLFFINLDPEDATKILKTCCSSKYKDFEIRFMNRLGLCDITLFKRNNYIDNEKTKIRAVNIEFSKDTAIDTMLEAGEYDNEIEVSGTAILIERMYMTIDEVKDIIRK